MAKKKFFKVGDNIWFHGDKKIYRIVGENIGFWIGYPVDEIQMASTGVHVFGFAPAVEIPKGWQIEEPVIEKFSIGDRVGSAHTFTGRVTGFEMETNRAVCISDNIDKSSNDRGRWAYKVHEIDIIPNTIEFKLNRLYHVRTSKGNVKLRAIEHMHQRDYVTLYDNSTGKLFGHAPATADLDDLADNLGIEDIKIA